MVDLSGGSVGPIEHGFSNAVFVIPGSVVIGLSAMDLLYGLQGLAADKAEDVIPELPVPDASEFPIPTNAELLAMLDDLTDLTHEERELLRVELTKSVYGESQAGIPEAAAFSYQLLMLFAMLAIVIIIFVFFGYKLYKSLVERERKREEKKKNKQQKKKK